MAVKSREELLASIQARLGEDNSDDALAFIEDVTDTIDDYESRVNDTEDWKTKYEENDNAWRTKYKERFFNAESQQEDEGEFEETETPITTFEQLFEVKEG